MDEKYMQPFVTETIKTMEVMFGARPEEGEMLQKDSPDGTYDISAMVGISGAGQGAVVVSFPKDVACRVVSSMSGEELTEIDQDVADGIGELVNIITGNAKRGLNALGFGSISLSLPNVVVGRHRTVWRTKDMPCLMKKLFISDLGPFCVEVNVRKT
jgi:chemotaxis protein CheX